MVRVRAREIQRLENLLEDAGIKLSTNTRPGNPYLKGTLGIAAMSAARSKDTYLAAKYRRIASRGGPVKAIVAVEHAILIAIRNISCAAPIRRRLGRRAERARSRPSARRLPGRCVSPGSSAAPW